MKIWHITAALSALFFGILLLPDDTVTSLTSEGSWVEEVTVAAYAGVLIYMVSKGLASELPWIFCLILLLMLRELDFDARFTTAKITRSAFLFGADTPPLQRVYGFALLGFVALVVVMVVVRHGRRLLWEAKARSVIAAATGLAVFAAIFSKSIDGLRRKLGYVGVDLEAHGIAVAQLLEETVELSIPPLILVGLMHYARQTQLRG